MILGCWENDFLHEHASCKCWSTILSVIVEMEKITSVIVKMGKDSKCHCKYGIRYWVFLQDWNSTCEEDGFFQMREKDIKCYFKCDVLKLDMDHPLLFTCSMICVGGHTGCQIFSLAKLKVPKQLIWKYRQFLPTLSPSGPLGTEIEVQ